MTQLELKQLLHYDKKTGLFTWLKSGSGRKNSVGSIDKGGYLRVQLNGKGYKMHRLAWLYVYGKFPPEQIDHKNRKRTDNWIDNLRAVTPRENSLNQSKFKTNTSGKTGVTWHKLNNKWCAFIYVDKKRKHLGYFNDLEQAIIVRAEAEVEFGYFGATK